MSISFVSDISIYRKYFPPCWTMRKERRKQLKHQATENNQYFFKQKTRTKLLLRYHIHLAYYYYKSLMKTLVIDIIHLIVFYGCFQWFQDNIRPVNITHLTHHITEHNMLSEIKTPKVCVIKNIIIHEPPTMVGGNTRFEAYCIKAVHFPLLNF